MKKAEKPKTQNLYWPPGHTIFISHHNNDDENTFSTNNMQKELIFLMPLQSKLLHMDKV